MNALRPRRSVLWKLTALVTAIVAGLLSAMLAGGFLFWRGVLREQIDARLRATAESRRNFVREWIGHQQDRAGAVASHAEMRTFIENPGSGASAGQFRAWFQEDFGTQIRSPGVLGARFADLNGRVLLSSDRTEIGQNLTASPVFRAGLREPAVGLPEPAGERFVVLAAAPCRRAGGGGEVLGVVLLTLDATPLAAVQSDTSGLGATGEVLLGVRVDGRIQYLFPPRHHGAFTVPLTDVPAMAAATEGRELFDRTRDYRGEPVLAVGWPVGYGGWGLVAKMDAAEAYAPIARAGRQALLLGGIIGLVGLGAAFLVARSFSRPIQRLLDGVQRVAACDYCAPVPVETDDEFGALASGFNEMTAALRLQKAERDAHEAALREREALLRSATDNAAVGLVMLDRKRRYTFANPAYVRILGLPCNADELIGQGPAEILASVYAIQISPPLDRAFAGERVRCEMTRPLPGASPGEMEYYEVVYDPKREDTNAVTGVIVTIFDITERKRLEHDILEIGAHEQRRIGQDLHDDLCQWLAGTQFLAGALAGDLAQRSPADAVLARKIADSIGQASARARTLAHGLTPAVIKSAGLAGALRELAANAAETFRIRCHYDGPETLLLRNEAAALHLYRIAQEAIGNAVRHGGASQVQILLQPGENRMMMLIRDDGSGMPQPLPATPGMGLRTMRYRAGMIAATLEIRPNANGGTEIACVFPRDL